MPIFTIHQKIKNPRKVLIYRDFLCFTILSSGETGIRTPGTAAIDHSATSPKLPFRSAFVESVAKVRLYFKYARLLNKKN
mgnify:CR=1 FL=1